MKPLRILSVLFLSLALSHPIWSQDVIGKPQELSAESSIRAVMEKSRGDWNRGDLVTFAKMYKDSPDILFIANRVSHGYAGMLESYRRNYATPEARGVLTYTNVEVYPLDARFATVTGNCHLERTVAGGGNFDCIYSLTFEKTAEGWKVVVDHSSAIHLAAKPVTN